MIITTAMLNALGQPNPADKELGAVSYEDRIAAVLGHEITHAAAGHGARSMQVGLFIALVSRISSFVIPRLVIQRGKDESQLSYDAKVRAMEISLDFGWSIGSFFFKMHNSRCHEFEADKFGIKYAAKAGYDPKGALWIQHMFMHMEKKDPNSKTGFLEFFRTHPFSENRLKANTDTIDAIHRYGITGAFA